MLESKEFHIKLADACNRMYKKDRRTDIRDAYKSLTGEEWPYWDVYTKQYADFASRFLANLAEAKIKLSSKLLPPESTVVLKCPPKKAPVLGKTGAFSLKFVTQKNNKYKGVSVIGEEVYGTNGHILLRLHDARWQEHSGKVIPYEELALLEAGMSKDPLETNLLPYRNVIPSQEESEYFATVDLKGCTDKVCGAVFMFDNLAGLSFFRFRSEETGKSFLLSPKQLLTLLQILIANGAKKADIYLHPQGWKIAFYADNGNLGMITKCPQNSFNSVIVEETVASNKKEKYD